MLHRQFVRGQLSPMLEKLKCGRIRARRREFALERDPEHVFQRTIALDAIAAQIMRDRYAERRRVQDGLQFRNAQLFPLLGVLALGDIAAHRGQADRVSALILENENVVDHPYGFACPEMPEADLGFGATFPHDPGKKIVQNEILVLGKEEVLHRRLARGLDIVETDQA
ncbi:hypothetical protein M2323_004344 [Rhodoblastus acidophilus]|nr:hypothetical protein [Rhodoblastus acidophilus]MCW2335396.1 hypothetical protein [Rhodoblastus acidophilus]